MKDSKNIYLIIPAGGSGKRMNSPIPKQLIHINDAPIIIHTLKKFDNIKEINKIIIASDKDYIQELKSQIKLHQIKTDTFFVQNGIYRHNSVYNALNSDHCKDANYVLIHDAVRPNVSNFLINDIINSLKNYDAVIPAIPAKDTIKLIDDDSFVLSTLEREKLRHIQTPQAFKYNIIIDAFRLALSTENIFTDDSSIAEFAGIKVKVINGEESNIKITTQEDLKLIKL